MSKIRKITRTMVECLTDGFTLHYRLYFVFYAYLRIIFPKKTKVPANAVVCAFAISHTDPFHPYFLATDRDNQVVPNQKFRQGRFAFKLNGKFYMLPSLTVWENPPKDIYSEEYIFWGLNQVFVHKHRFNIKNMKFFYWVK